MAEEVEMTPVADIEPPKADPLAKPAAPLSETAQAKPVARPTAPTGTGLKPGLKLPPKPGLGAGIKLPPKPGAQAGTGLKPGLKLPTQNALKPGVRLPPKPVIRKPGSTVVASPLPKPLPKPITPTAAAPAPAPAAPAAPSAAPAAPAPSAEPKAVAPVAVDAQGVGKLPTVEAKAISRADASPVVSENPKPLEALKTVTQKLKGITQEIPAQAILRKTGIIADGVMSDAQKEAAKHKTARISLSDAMGVAPVKNENAPMKTIRIKRPADISSGGTAPLKPQPPAPAPAAPSAAAAAEGETQATADSSATATQRKTLKITRPGGGVVRPNKFGLKRPASATQAPTAKAESSASGDGAVADIPEIADIPDLPPVAPMPAPAPAVSDGPAWVWTLSSLVQLAACIAIGALAWFLYQNTQTAYF